MAYTDKNKLRVVYGDYVLGVHGEGFDYIFSYAQGGLESVVKNGYEWLYRCPKPTFWRALTDNDRGSKFHIKSGGWLAADMFIDCQEIEVIMDGEVQEPYAPDNNSYGGDVAADEIIVKYTYETINHPSATVIVTYTVGVSGKIRVDVHYNGVKGLPEFPVFGMRFIMPTLADKYLYKGLSGETYPDRKAGAKEEWAILSGVKTTYYQFTGNQNDPLIKMYFELSRRRYRGVGCWGISYYPQYTPEERKQTAGYWLQGGIICYVTDRYDKYSRKWCDVCHDYAGKKEPMLLKRSKTMEAERMEKKIYQTAGFAMGGEFLVSEGMYQYLLKNGVSRENFIPAYFGGRKKELACYQIKPVHVLPKGSIQYGNCKETPICPKCGNGRLVRETALEHYEGSYLDMTQIDFTKDFYESFEYVQGCKMTIVSPKIWKLLKEADKKIDAFPLFPRIMKEGMEQSAML